jgi:glycerophosphoryl diester phosphodiesterase
VSAVGGGVWSPAFDTLTAELVGEAQGLGLEVVPWTVNEAADMARLIGWGVDGLITDRPDIALLLRA